MHQYPYTMNHQVIVETLSKKKPQYQSVREHQNQSNGLDHRHDTQLRKAEKMSHATDEAVKDLPSYHVWGRGTVEVPSSTEMAPTRRKERSDKECAAAEE